MTCPDVTIDSFCAVKDPSEVLDYTIDYGTLLNAIDPADTIVASSWAVRAHISGIDLTIQSDSFSDTTATVWLADGGKSNNRHAVVNTITTAGGRKFERTILIWIQSK